MLNIYTSIHVYLMMPLPCFMSSLDPFFRWLLTNNSTLKKCRIRTNIRRRIQKIKKIPNIAISEKWNETMSVSKITTITINETDIFQENIRPKKKKKKKKTSEIQPGRKDSKSQRTRS